MRTRSVALAVTAAALSAGCTTSPGAARHAISSSDTTAPSSATSGAPAAGPSTAAHTPSPSGFDWTTKTYRGVCPDGIDRVGKQFPVDLDADGQAEIAVALKCRNSDAGALPVYKIEQNQPRYLGLALDGRSGEKLQAVVDDNGILLVATYGWTPDTARTTDYDAAVTREWTLADGRLRLRNTFYDPVVVFDAENEGIHAADPTDPHAHESTGDTGRSHSHDHG